MAVGTAGILGKCLPDLSAFILQYSNLYISGERGGFVCAPASMYTWKRAFSASAGWKGSACVLRDRASRATSVTVSTSFIS